MISSENRRKILKAKYGKYFFNIIPYILAVLTFIICNIFKLEYKEDFSLVNDKVIDVCSIFFGIFAGCIFLFDKFNDNEIHKEFLKFSKMLLFKNAVLIIYSFLIILFNNNITSEIAIMDYCIYPKVIFFSLYICLLSLTLLSLIRFINMIFILLKGAK